MQFREHAYKMVDFICDYYKGLEDTNVLSGVQVSLQAATACREMCECSSDWSLVHLNMMSCISRRDDELRSIMTCQNFQIVMQPGYLKELLPSQAPEAGQSFDSIMQDVKTKIMPGKRGPPWARCFT